MRPRLGAAVVAVSVLLVVGGCGGSSDSSTSATGTADSAAGKAGDGSMPEACSVITTDEVAQVLSEHSPDHATYTVQATPGASDDCTYAWTVDGSGDEFSVNVFPASSYVKQPGIEPRQIDGIGDEAFEEVGSYYARVGDLMVNVVNLQEGEGSDEALLRIAAARLGH